MVSIKGMIITMHVPKGAVAGGASVVLLALASPIAGRTAPASLPLADEGAPPPSYTFRLDVGMAMRHFPWLHFHLEGDGVYDPGETYKVHFTTIPWFAPRKQHDADLSMLDPLMWPKHYTYQEIGEANGNRLFELHSLDDPTLSSATVAIGPRGKARQVDASYTDGTHIEMHVSSSDVDGFFLPQNVTADIDEPHLALSATGDFKDYTFASPLPNSTQ